MAGPSGSHTGAGQGGRRVGGQAGGGRGRPKKPVGQGHGRPRKGKGKGVGKNSGWRLAHCLAGEDSRDESFSDEGGREEEVEEVATVVMVPGKGWDPSADTDEDSDPEEDPTGKGIKLPRNLLFGEASLTTRGAGWGFWAGKYMRMVLRAGKFMRMVLRAGK